MCVRVLNRVPNLTKGSPNNDEIGEPRVPNFMGSPKFYDTGPTVCDTLHYLYI